MNSAIGAILPLAIGVAISPVPIIAAVLMLLSPKARTTSVGFLLGWLIGIIAAVTIFTLLSSVITEQDPDASAPIRGIVQLVLGGAALWVALGQWRKRPKPGEEPVLPKWMQAIDQASFPFAFGLGFVLGSVNPKNLLLAASAGTTIGALELSAGAVIVVIAVYTLVAGCTVLVPVLGYLVAAEKLREPLNALRRWLTQENATIMAVLMLVLGVQLLGKGIGSF